MNEILRPSTLGEILDRTAQIYRRNFWLFAGIGALPIGVMIAAAALALLLISGTAVLVKGGNISDSISIPLAVVVLLVVLSAYFTAAIFSMGGLTQAAVSAYRGEKPTIRGALASVRPRFWRYLWYTILQGLYVAVIPLAVAFALAVPLFFLLSKAREGPDAAVAAGALVFLVFAIAFGVIIWRALGYAVGFPVCVAEQKTAWQSLKRAWQLSQGSRGRIFVMFLLVAALAFAVSMAASIPFLIVVAFLAPSGDGTGPSTTFIVAEIARIVVDFTVQALLAPVSWIALVLFYFDQRIRKEGFDIEWMMQQAGLIPQQAGIIPDAYSGSTPIIAAPAVAQNPSTSGPVAPAVNLEER